MSMSHRSPASRAAAICWTSRPGEATQNDGLSSSGLMAASRSCSTRVSRSASSRIAASSSSTRRASSICKSVHSSAESASDMLARLSSKSTRSA
eukprot:5820000-Prymnesium_polylepis.2